MTNTQEITISTDMEGKISARASDLCAAAARAVATNAEEAGKCADLVRLIKDCFNAADKERRTIVDPLNATVKHINSRFKTITEPLQIAEGTVKKALLDYQQEEERKAREAAALEQKRREEEALAIAAAKEEKGDTIGAEVAIDHAARATVLPMPAAPVAGGLTGAKASTTKRWTYRVTDIAALAKAQPGCVEVKPAAVMGLFRGGITEIPGVEFYQEESVSVR